MPDISKDVQKRRDILVDAIKRMDGYVNFGTIVTVDGRKYNVTIIEEV